MLFRSNSELTWEKQFETNVGFDLGLWNNRVSIIVDAYQRNGFDLIGQIKTSGIGGEFFKNANYADMKSQGVDFGFAATVLDYKDFSWKTNFNYGFNKNEITKLKSLPLIYDLTRPEGGPREGYSVRGIFSLDFQGLNDKGIPTLINEEGEKGTIVDIQSQTIKYLKYEGPRDPTYFGGFSNTFNYKAFSLNVFMSFQGGNKVRLDPVFTEGTSNGVVQGGYTDLAATPREISNRWVLPGEETITNIPSFLGRPNDTKLATSEFPYTAYNVSSVRVVNGDFARLKNVSLGYTLPAPLVKKMGLKGLTIRASAANLMLLYSDKKLYGQDPEFFGSGGVALPISRQITFSIKASI